MTTLFYQISKERRLLLPLLFFFIKLPRRGSRRCVTTLTLPPILNPVCDVRPPGPWYLRSPCCGTFSRTAPLGKNHRCRRKNWGDESEEDEVLALLWFCYSLKRLLIKQTSCKLANQYVRLQFKNLKFSLKI